MMQLRKLVMQISQREQTVYAVWPAADYMKPRLIKELRAKGLDVRPIDQRINDLFSEPIYVSDFDPKLLRNWKADTLLMWLDSKEHWEQVIGMDRVPLELDKFPAATVAKELSERYARFGVKVDPKAIDLLAASTPPEQAEALLDRLTLEQEEVGLADLASSNRPKEVNVFGFYDAILAARQREAKVTLLKLMGSSHPLEILKALSTLNRKTMIAFDAVVRGYGAEQVAAATGSPEWVAKKMIAQCEQVDYGRLVQIHYTLAAMDRDIKQFFRDEHQTLCNGLMLMIGA